MIDIKLVREKKEFVYENLRKRNKEIGLDELTQCDKSWREMKIQIDRLRYERNKASERIADLKRKKMDVKNVIKEMKEISSKISTMEKKLEMLGEKRKNLLLKIPNLLHESVPLGKDSSENVEIRRWGEIKNFSFKPKSHIEIVESLGLADIGRAAKVSGARFYYLKDELFRLGLALTMFTIDRLKEKGFTPMETPFMLTRKAMQGAVSLSDFEDVIYKIEGEDLYLIATAEHTLLAYHMDEIFDENELPKCYLGYSTNFRKEAGAHGKDTKGIFRVHQFDKVEQFVFCKPENSWKWHEKLIKNAEELYQMLKIPYRIVNVCTGDLGSVAAKKYDLEAWMPAQKQYREVVSCSNCTDYQARRLKIRYRKKDGTKYVHTLNSTAIAIQRTLVAILENCQRKDGSIHVPHVLQKYVGFKRIG